jgi:hypothetical protein
MGYGSDGVTQTRGGGAQDARANLDVVGSIAQTHMHGQRGVI